MMAAEPVGGTDTATSSSYRHFRVRHFHLELRVNFDRRQLEGREVLELSCVRPDGGGCGGGERELRLDTHSSLCVQSVTARSAGGDAQSLPFEIQPFTNYGATLVLTLAGPCRHGDQLEVTIHYKATDGPGVVWLDPEQTAGKVKPYLFTQGQAVLNRSFFPCFDTPAVKSTYSASIKVPEGFTAVMSATKWEHDQKQNIFHFKMHHPIPSYLVALAVGDIVSAEVGPRSRVWTEPCLLDAAKEEYDGVVEEFLNAGEKLFGPYVWGRYDLLFMPPSFPFGGMENPCLTFVTPCLLAGDRSLADVIIHEISHSWFGNLVTNANWGDFWLNEGFTMYAQRRITTELYGAAYTCLEAATGRALLRQHMDNTGEDHPLNKLKVKIEAGIDPDETYNETPYEKGYCFVSYLAHLVGDQEKFDAFLRAYVEKFKFQSIVAEDTLNFYLNYFPELKEKDVEKRPGFEFDGWLNTPGWPPYLPDLTSGDTLMKPAENLAALWLAADLSMDAIKAIDVSSWRTYQIVYFLDKLLEKSPLPPGNVAKLAETYPKISKAKNAELRFRWVQIIVKNNYEEAFDELKNFLRSQGKQKYTVPVYRAMWSETEGTRKLAQETFAATKNQLHKNVQNYVKKILV
ncbi:aminopeptidase B isoform X1 [Scyliorhinus canicula]|uniref:aminopeptidase B isoform X1 n=1 Tax=Scyliorhinus canicula TaxID=7830 RepID=UPI0018F714EE|nr:aminopeptidase B isoform X1 [Scyliorhinus canicula]